MTLAKTSTAGPMCLATDSPRARHDRDEPLDDLVRREHERRRAISPGSLEPQLQAAVVELGQPVGGDRRTREVASHALEPLAIVGPDARGGLEVESLDLRAQLRSAMTAW
jgi:hypothetical protein